LDHAHAAIAGDGKLRVIAVARNRDADIDGRLNDGLAFGGDDFLAVDGDFYRIHVQIQVEDRGSMMEDGVGDGAILDLLSSILVFNDPPCTVSLRRALRIRRETCG